MLLYKQFFWVCTEVGWSLCEAPCNLSKLCSCCINIMSEGETWKIAQRYSLGRWWKITNWMNQVLIYDLSFPLNVCLSLPFFAVNIISVVSIGIRRKTFLHHMCAVNGNPSQQANYDDEKVFIDSIYHLKICDVCFCSDAKAPSEWNLYRPMLCLSILFAIGMKFSSLFSSVCLGS